MSKNQTKPQSQKPQLQPQKPPPPPPPPPPTRMVFDAMPPDFISKKKR